MNTNCAQCGKPLYRRPSRIKQFANQFCDFACKGQWQSEHPRPKNKVTVKCTYCQKPKRVYPSRLSPKLGHFCNQTCRGKWQTQQGVVTLTCHQCGKDYQIARYFTENRNSRFCSKNCAFRAMRKERRGKSNPQWRGGGKLPYGPDWHRIARKIRKRDNHTCQVCHKHHKRLDVHHIKPLRDFNGDLQSAHHPQNLVTLCRHCHRAVEHGKTFVQARLF